MLDLTDFLSTIETTIETTIKTPKIKVIIKTSTVPFLNKCTYEFIKNILPVPVLTDDYTDKRINSIHRQYVPMTFYEFEGKYNVHAMFCEEECDAITIREWLKNKKDQIIPSMNWNWVNDILNGSIEKCKFVTYTQLKPLLKNDINALYLSDIFKNREKMSLETLIVRARDINNEKKIDAYKKKWITYNDDKIIFKKTEFDYRLVTSSLNPNAAIFHSVAW